MAVRERSRAVILAKNASGKLPRRHPSKKRVREAIRTVIRVRNALGKTFSAAIRERRILGRPDQQARALASVATSRRL